MRRRSPWPRFSWARVQLPVIAITGRPAGLERALRDGLARGRHRRRERLGACCAGQATGCGAISRRTKPRVRPTCCGCADVPTAVLQALPQGQGWPATAPAGLTDIAVDHGEFEHLDDVGTSPPCSRSCCAHACRASVSSIHINGWIGAHDKMERRALGGGSRRSACVSTPRGVAVRRRLDQRPADVRAPAAVGGGGQHPPLPADAAACRRPMSRRRSAAKALPRSCSDCSTPGRRRSRG